MFLRSLVLVTLFTASFCDDAFLSTDLACPEGGNITRAEFCEENPRCAHGEDSDTTHPYGPCIKVGEGPLDYRFDCGSSEDSVPLDAMCNGSVDCGNGNDERNEFCPAYQVERSSSCPVCLNGGVCRRRRCRCPEGWSGRRCQRAVCIPSCANGGTCTGPNDCQCASGWSGIDCQTPVCIPSCANGRTCTGPNDCQCASGWGGLDCETPQCTPPCPAGKVCTSPNLCEFENGAGGDPHFLVNLPDNSNLCFSLQGEPGFAFNLVTSETIVINAVFIDAPPRLQDWVTVIGEIGVLYYTNSGSIAKLHFDFKDKSIYVSGYGVLDAKRVFSVLLEGDRLQINSGNVTKNWASIVNVSIGDELEFKVFFNHDSLDIVWSNVGTFNHSSHGILGQFFNKGTRIDKDNKQLVLPKRSPIPVNLEDPKPEVHHKSQCWRPQTPGYQGEGLIEGDYVEYVVSSVFATDFKYSLTFQ